MTRICFLILLLVNALYIHAQSISVLSIKTYGGNKADYVGSFVTKTSDGGFVIGLSSLSDSGTGTIDSLCNLSASRSVFIKYNSDATSIEWLKCLAVTGDSAIGYIFPTADGKYVLAGEYTGGWGFNISKQDSAGNVIWNRAYSKGNGSLLKAVIQTSDGGYIMTGQSYHTDSNVLVHYGSWMDADIWVLKLDSLGNKMWSKIIGGTGDDDVCSVVEISGTKNYYIVGTTPSNDYDCTGNHGGYDAYVARLDSNGNIMWHNDLGGTQGDGADFAVADGKGGVIVAASTSSPNGDVTHYISPGQDIWVLNLDSSNNIVWNNCYGGGGGNCYPNAVCQATDGSIWIAGVISMQFGEIDTSYGRDDAWFVHTDSVGDFLSARVMGSRLWDRGQMIYPLSGGSVIAGGFYDTACADISNTWYGEYDAFLVTFSPFPEAVPPITVKDNSYIIYPNPTNQVVNIKTIKPGILHIVIADIFGREIYDNSISEKNVCIPVINWAKGIYFVQAGSENGNYSGKIIIE